MAKNVDMCSTGMTYSIASTVIADWNIRFSSRINYIGVLVVLKIRSAETLADR
jgi:hypothetical protein